MKVLHIITFILLGISLTASSRNVKTDVCIYGETPAGITSAIAAARMGMKTVLISRISHIGGMATSGLTATDINRHDKVGGIAAEFYGRIYEYYENDKAWRNQTRDEFMASTLKRTFSGKNDARKIQWVYESHVGEEIMRQMLSEANVTLIADARLLEKNGVEMKKSKIESISLSDGTSVRAKVFIDCTYEGDLMAQSGVSYIVGRESRSKYGESLAGIHLSNPSEIELYDKDGNILPFVDAKLWGNEGDGDKRTQCYCYRLTLTDDADNMIPVTKPANYDERWFELVYARKIKNKPDVKLKDIITFTPMPNRKTDTNHLDFVGACYDYPEAGYEARKTIEAAHKDYAIGMLWFLGHDEKVPENLRQEMQRWGFAKDEFVDNGGFPYQIYVREARRMIGEYVMVQNNVERNNRVDAPNSVGIGTYMLDCHYVSNVASDKDKVMIEGSIFQSTKPYTISYYSLTPKRDECQNLLVPVCLSASHVAYTTIRMEPTYMVLGQASGTAAALAVKGKCKIQDVDYNKLKTILLKNGQIISYKNTKI